jgi:hypothetical protein
MNEKAVGIGCCAILGLLTLCLCCLALAPLGGAIFYLIETQPVSRVISPGSETPTPQVIRPGTVMPRATLRPERSPTRGFSSTPRPTIARRDTATPQFSATPAAVNPPLSDLAYVSTETLLTLQQAQIPVRDPFEVAARLQGITDIAPTVSPAPAYDVGDRQTFWVTNGDTNQSFQVKTVLRSETEHSYFWIEDGVAYDEDELSRLARTFESSIYPNVRAFFGSEWTPGIDGDPHLYIIYARGLGFSIAGYFSSSDSYPAAVAEFSNEHETFMFNADTTRLGDADTYGTLAHEFQHMIHWNLDRNETTWVNEGFSVLSELLNDYPVYFDDSYTADPDLQLNDWLPDPGDNLPHYGASFLFAAYGLGRFGEDFTQQWAADPRNGFESLDWVLADLDVRDPLTGRVLRSEDVFADWVIANYIQDAAVGDGRFSYPIYPDAPHTSPTETFHRCPVEAQTRSVHQFGVDYIQFVCRGRFTLRFEGSLQTSVVPPKPHSGSYFMWSNKGDESDMTLTRQFDFRSHDGPLTLTYWAWYDLERDFDYAYLLASTDGETWQILDTPSCTRDNLTGANLGCGWNGISHNAEGRGSRGEQGQFDPRVAWVQEALDLSAFAGKQVWLRFEYLTDAAINGEGLLLDDLAIPEIGYTADFETDAGGWESAGFVRIQNILPQTFRLAWITLGDEITVQTIPLAADVHAEIVLDLPDGQSGALVVAATTRFTRIPAAYRFEVTR